MRLAYALPHSQLSHSTFRAPQHLYPLPPGSFLQSPTPYFEKIPTSFLAFSACDSALLNSTCSVDSARWYRS